MPLPGKYTYAQQGEDVALWQILHHMLGIEHPTYMDIGAHTRCSTTTPTSSTDAASRGAGGAHPILHRVLEKERPRDVLVRAGIGVTAQAGDFYVIGGSADGQLNTFSREQAEPSWRAPRAAIASSAC